MRTLSFEASSHTYTVDGAVVPSATEIAAKVVGKDMTKIPPAALAKARQRGQEIHEDVQRGTCATPEGTWIYGKLPDNTEHEKAGYCIIDGLLIAGTADLVHFGGIDDIKSESKPDVLYWTIQLNIYARIFQKKNLRVLYVPKTGNYSIVPIQYLSDEKMIEVVNAYREGKVLTDEFLAASEKPESPSLDLVVYSHSVGELTTNAKAILETVKKQLAGYSIDNYSEDNIADAKRDKAELNAAAKKLNDKRIELEREFMKPFNEFKDTIAETCTLIKTASGQIDGLVKAVEDREKAAKKQLVTESWNMLGFFLVPLEKVWNPVWLNKGAKVKDIVDEMKAIIDKINQDILVLDRINEPEAKAHYLNTLSLDAALAEVDRIMENRQRIAAAEQARKEAAEARLKLSEAQKEIVIEPVKVEPVKIEASPTEPELLERTFRVRCTMDQLVELGNFMNRSKILFQKL